MNFSIPLDKMSVEDKLQAIEEIWADLVVTPENIPSPSWHADVLKAREKRISEETSRFLDVAEAKNAVKEKIKTYSFSPGQNTKPAPGVSYR